MEPQSNKRKLEEPATLSRSPDVCFEDGNIVLAVGETAFRVHRGQLSRHSVVFRDMFAVSEPSGDDDVFEECPVVRLHDDPKAVAAFLGALYDFVQYNPESLDKALLILPLAHKYIVETLRSSILDLLQKCFPGTLREWRAIDRPRISIQQKVTVIKVAREVGALYILPAAFYSLVPIPLTQTLRCFDSASDMAVFCLGVDGLRGAYANLSNEALKISPTCGRHTCVESLESLKATEKCAALKNATTPGCGFDLLREADKLADSVSKITYPSVCSACTNLCNLSIVNCKAKLWTQLPGFFGLGSWEKLREGAK